MSSIFLVDDQPYMQYFLKGELAEMGHFLKWLQSGESLLLELEENRPDLVLLDLFIDGLAGWTLLGDIKRRDQWIPVILLTAYDNFSNDARLSHAQGYIIKSIDTTDLRNKIAAVLASSVVKRAQGVSRVSP